MTRLLDVVVVDVVVAAGILAIDVEARNKLATFPVILFEIKTGFPIRVIFAAFTILQRK